MFRRRAPELNTIAEADDRCCLCMAAVVIRCHDQQRMREERYSNEEKAPNSKSPTELPGANRSWVAIGDEPEVLQQRGRDSVKSEANIG